MLELLGLFVCLGGLIKFFSALGDRNYCCVKLGGSVPRLTLCYITALTPVENKIPSLNNLVKKTDYNAKISEIKNKINDHDHGKYITTPEFNKLTAQNFTTGLKQEHLASKGDIANFAKKTDFDNKLKDVTSNKNELNDQSKKGKAISTQGLKKIW